MRAWSLKVGEPKGSFPIMTARRTNGCCKSVRVELRREAAGLYFAADLRFDQFEQFFVGIEFVCPDIDGEFAAVRNDIVLCPGVDNRDAHFHRSEEIAFFRELIGVEPFDVFHRKRDRIDPLVPGGMSCLAGADTVQDHQPFFGYGRLHAGRFADNGECDRGKVARALSSPFLPETSSSHEARKIRL